MHIRLYAGALAVVCASFVVTSCGSDSKDTTTAASIDPNAPVLDVTAKSFSFDPKQITVKSGDTKTLVLHVKDLSHDFTVKELDIHVHGGVDDTVKQTLTFDKPGTYQYFCSIAGHREAGMEGTLTVT